MIDEDQVIILKFTGYIDENEDTMDKPKKLNLRKNEEGEDGKEMAQNWEEIDSFRVKVVPPEIVRNKGKMN